MPPKPHASLSHEQNHNTLLYKRRFLDKMRHRRLKGAGKQFLNQQATRFSTLFLLGHKEDCFLKRGLFPLLYIINFILYSEAAASVDVRLTSVQLPRSLVVPFL